jgi:hemerythrin-like domain-containing protein
MATSVQSVTTELEAEHRVIHKVVSVMAALQHDILSEHAVDVTALRNVVEFMRVFGDELHHGKEEDVLFPALEAAGVPVKGCPIGALRAEHDQGRELVAALAEAIDSHESGDASARADISRVLDELMELYPRHIWKEDYLAFPMSEKVLSNEVKAEVARRFEAVDERLREARERMEVLAEALHRAHHSA